jgi:hypothetical protein
MEKLVVVAACDKTRVRVVGNGLQTYPVWQTGVLFGSGLKRAIIIGLTTRDQGPEFEVVSDGVVVVGDPDHHGLTGIERVRPRERECGIEVDGSGIIGAGLRYEPEHVDRKKKLRFQQCPIIGIPLS